MEFGAGICRSRDPRCDVCPVARGCPSRSRAAVIAVSRQPMLRGSDRAYRGAVLRLLSAADDHTLDGLELRAGVARDAWRIGPVLDDTGWLRVVEALERDGLAHRSGGIVRLGTATIGP
jgi:hypothetical protein